jgi:SAM-dependent methyltransferase
MTDDNDWAAAANRETDDELRERILTGYRDGKPFTPYVPTIALPEPIDTVLDFGCGLGRNFPYLKTIARRVVGFDLPPMIARCRTLAPVAVDTLVDDWNAMRTARVDLVFASLVLQHIETPQVARYLDDFARMAPVVYLLTRTNTDFGARVLDLVADTGAFEAGECVEVEHDPTTHRLRPVATRPFADARAAAPGLHVEVMLRSTLYVPS